MEFTFLRGINCSGIEWRIAHFGLECAKKNVHGVGLHGDTYGAKKNFDFEQVS